MQQIVQFIHNHFWLSISWLVLLAVLMVTGLKKRFSAISVISNREAIRLMNTANAQMVDTRVCHLFDKGHIAGSINITAEDIHNKNVGQLAQYQNNQLIVVCSDGSSAVQLARRLHPLGFSRVYALQHGITGWNSENLPLVKNRVNVKVQAKTTAKVEIYTRAACPYCIRAKELLNKLNIHFDEFLIEKDVSKKEEMVSRSGRTTVPQIFINGRAIGGCDDLYALNEQEGLLILL